MKIKFYGTSAGGGIPEIFCYCRVCEYARQHGGKDIRTRSQAVIDDCFGIEYPVDTFAHTAYRGLDMRKVRNILITHAHHDHFLTADILSRPQGIDKVNFYIPEASGRALKASIERQEEAYRNEKRPATFRYQYTTWNIIRLMILSVIRLLLSALVIKNRWDPHCTLSAKTTNAFYGDSIPVNSMRTRWNTSRIPENALILWYLTVL